ncbi:MAG: hypothetical protein KF716_05370 [Anaerolineae bacterium]|nr:hypothetical protein [Anaerolineae bacterium]
MPTQTAAQTGTATPTNDVAATPTLSSVPVTMSVSGKVSSGTAGVTLPAALPLTLNLVTTDAAGRVDIQTQAGTMQADSSYRFEGVTVKPGTSIFVTTTYENVVQGSLIGEAGNEGAALDLPIKLYAGTDDPSVIVLERAQQILDFKAGNIMQVLATYYYRDTSDRFFLSKDLNAQNKPISVTIPLPVGAQSIAFTNNVGTRYSIGGSPMLPSVQDTRPVLPGQTHEVIVSYNVPYDKGAPIDQDYPFTTQMVEVLIPDDAGVRLQGEFNANPNISINPQRSYTQYNLKQPIKAGGRLIYTLEGVPPNQAITAVPSGSTRSSNSADFLPIVLLAGLIVIGFVLVIVYLFRPKRGAK